MNNYKDLISSFNDKGTLLKWLKDLEKAVKESNIKFLDYVELDDSNNKLKVTMSFDNNVVESNSINFAKKYNHTLSVGDDSMTFYMNYINEDNSSLKDINLYTLLTHPYITSGDEYYIASGTFYNNEQTYIVLYVTKSDTSVTIGYLNYFILDDNPPVPYIEEFTFNNQNIRLNIKDDFIK